MTRKQTRIALIGGVFAIASLAVTLVLVALGDTVAYFYTPGDLARMSNPPTGIIRLGGLVADGSVAVADGAEAQVRFNVSDGEAIRTVSYKGILPDLFREGQGVVVQGRLRADGTLEALEVLAKHDETYMPKEVADALKAKGQWREGV